MEFSCYKIDNLMPFAGDELKRVVIACVIM